MSLHCTVDTSDSATDLSELSGFDFDDFKGKWKSRDSEPSTAVTVTGDLASAVEISMSVDQNYIEFVKTKGLGKVMKPVPGFPCVFCKDEEEMKLRVLETHLRPVVFCSECGKGVPEDKILQHKKTSCWFYVFFTSQKFKGNFTCYAKYL